MPESSGMVLRLCWARKSPIWSGRHKICQDMWILRVTGMSEEVSAQSWSGGRTRIWSLPLRKDTGCSLAFELTDVPEVKSQT